MIRCTGDILAMSPPLIAEKQDLDRLIEIVSKVIKQTA